MKKNPRNRCSSEQLTSGLNSGIFKTQFHQIPLLLKDDNMLINLSVFQISSSTSSTYKFSKSKGGGTLREK
jgi:hypothetical protein